MSVMWCDNLEWPIIKKKKKKKTQTRCLCQCHVITSTDQSKLATWAGRPSGRTWRAAYTTCLMTGRSRFSNCQSAAISDWLHVGPPLPPDLPPPPRPDRDVTVTQWTLPTPSGPVPLFSRRPFFQVDRGGEEKGLDPWVTWGDGGARRGLTDWLTKGSKRWPVFRLFLSVQASVCV